MDFQIFDGHYAVSPSFYYLHIWGMEILLNINIVYFLNDIMSKLIASIPPQPSSGFSSFASPDQHHQHITLQQWGTSCLQTGPHHTHSEEIQPIPPQPTELLPTRVKPAFHIQSLRADCEWAGDSVSRWEQPPSLHKLYTSGSILAHPAWPWRHQ